MYIGIVRQHPGVSHSVTAAALIAVQILAHGLPGSGPVVSGIIVSDIYVTPRLIKLVEDVAQDTAIGAGSGETVSSGIV